MKNAVYMGDTKISADEREMLMSDCHEISVAEFLEMAQRAGERFTEFMDWIKPRMTRGRAERIQQLRCVGGLSYRKLAGITHLEWGRDGNWYPETNQLAGLALGMAAAELLGENFQAIPWQEYQA